MQFPSTQTADSGGIATFVQSAPLRFNPIGFKHTVSVSAGDFDIEVQGPGGIWTRYSSATSPAIAAGNLGEVGAGFTGLRVTCSAGAGTTVSVHSWQ